MACCNITLTGINKDCEPSLGGVRRVWMANWCDVEGNVVVTDDVITSLPADIWHLYEFRKNTASLTSTINKDDTTGVIYVSSSLVLQLAGLDTAKRIEVVNMVKGELAVIAEDANGKFWYLGYDTPAEIADGSTAETGQAKADFNGYNLTFTDESREIPYEVAESAMEPIISPEEPA